MSFLKNAKPHLTLRRVRVIWQSRAYIRKVRYARGADTIKLFSVNVSAREPLFLSFSMVLENFIRKLCNVSFADGVS